MTDYPKPKSLAIDLYSTFLLYTYSENPKSSKVETRSELSFEDTSDIIDIATKLKENVFSKDIIDIVSTEKHIQIVVTIPDFANQHVRKGLLLAIESLRLLNKEKLFEELLQQLEDSKFEPKRTRILNRTNALAIAYYRKLIEDTKKSPFDRKLLRLKLAVCCADNKHSYIARFETKLGVVCQTEFKNYSNAGYYQKIKYYVDNKKPLEELVTETYNEYFKQVKKPNDFKTLIVLNEESFEYVDPGNIFKAEWAHFDDGSSLLRHKVFNTLPTLPSTNCLSLLGTDTKSRMLCGDVDYIDYDVPPVSLREVTLTYKKFVVSMIKMFEQLPIERTILESDKEIDFVVSRQLKTFLISLFRSSICLQRIRINSGRRKMSRYTKLMSVDPGFLLYNWLK